MPKPLESGTTLLYRMLCYLNVSRPTTTTYRSISSRVYSRKNQPIEEGSTRYRQNGLIAGSSPSHATRHSFVMLSQQCPRFTTITIDLLQSCSAESLTVTKVDVSQVHTNHSTLLLPIIIMTVSD